MDQNNRLIENINGLLLSSLKNIQVEKGNVLHAIKVSSDGFNGFGEAYFSIIDFGAVKGWKRHREMTLNLIVPVGIVKFVIYDDREESPTFDTFQEILLSREDNFKRLTVPPNLWVGFKGLSKDENIVLNIANIEHNPDEVDHKLINEIKYNWSI